jgi:crossover junction endodeoxyribonuclease RuvC
MAIIAGIDPGLTGALALYDTTTREILEIWDMPTLAIKRGKSVKHRVDVQALTFIIVDFKLFDVKHVYIEDVGGMPGQSAPAAFSFGFSAGLPAGMVAFAKIPCTPVAPATWKKALGLKGSKDDARYMASQLLPSAARHWQRKKDDGRAEAALIARYGAALFQTGLRTIQAA